MSLLFGVRGFAVYSDPPSGVYIAVGPWWARLNWRSFPGTYANGSRWFSGWHRWDDELEV